MNNTDQWQCSLDVTNNPAGALQCPCSNPVPEKCCIACKAGPIGIPVNNSFGYLPVPPGTSLPVGIPNTRALLCKATIRPTPAGKGKGRKDGTFPLEACGAWWTSGAEDVVEGGVEDCVKDGAEDGTEDGMEDTLEERAIWRAVEKW